VASIKINEKPIFYFKVILFEIFVFIVGKVDKIHNFLIRGLFQNNGKYEAENVLMFIK
jgi:hypothetical protein